GRKDAAANYQELSNNARLALQAAPVFHQLRGGGRARTVRFEFDLEARTLYREIELKDSAEALAYQTVPTDATECACDATAGYFAGYDSEILGRPIVTVETECIAKGDGACIFLSRFEPEWDGQADWARRALTFETIDTALAKRDELVETARKAEKRARNALNELNRRLRSDLMFESLVAQTPSMQPAMRRARQVMSCDAPVTIIGEPGVGRETFARAFHFGGARRKKPFVCVDCIALAGHLLTQDLFGYARDGIPGAARAYTGAYQRAHGGTLYLNEIANLSMEAQVLLLRAMREGVVFPIGADAPVKADVRLVVATQYDLQEKVENVEFLEHLYHALSVATLQLPPLRERGTDILRLAENFVAEFRDRYQRDDLAMTPDFKRVLLDCAWPGNVRQLRSAIEHAVIMAEGNTLDLGELPDDILATRVPHTQEELTKEVVLAALRRCQNNRTHAADLLGVGRTSLWRAMKRLGIT
ncbi:MAG: hypothetical protein GWP08_18700, partial [Nitrospiraceae bacterium]|nr:hypothetical protein [Nitrospiraceae bacterium]